MEESHNQSVPRIGESCYQDMISISSSPEAKANAARRYAEMMIDLFLSEKAKERLGETKFRKLSLGEQIREIENDFDRAIVEVLFNIKAIGDKGSHYSPDKFLSKEEAVKNTETALGLFDLILIDYLRKNALDKTYNTATIFSTLFPKVRANVLANLLTKGTIKENHDRAILHKYILALVKNGQKSKAKRFLDDKKKKGLLNGLIYKYEQETIRHISNGMAKNELPIPLTIYDCRRNFNEVVNELSEDERIENQGLIKIISTLLHEVTPSELGSFIPNKKYQITLEVNIQLAQDYFNNT